MSPEQWLVRGSAWLALLFYVAAEAVARKPKAEPARRWLFSLGGAVLIIHFAFAFHYRYEWSHAIAYRETAVQTAALTGLKWGWGVYLNYLFAFIWVAEALRQWRTRVMQPSKSACAWALRAFFLFMFVNAAVIFVRNPWRWFGLLCCLALVAAWLPRRVASGSQARAD